MELLHFGIMTHSCLQRKHSCILRQAPGLSWCVSGSVKGQVSECVCVLTLDFFLVICPILRPFTVSLLILLLLKCLRVFVSQLLFIRVDGWQRQKGCSSANVDSRQILWCRICHLIHVSSLRYSFVITVLSRSCLLVVCEV